MGTGKETHLFQSLIGRLQTKISPHEVLEKWSLFQSLIGRLQTAGRTSWPPTPGRFNPS